MLKELIEKLGTSRRQLAIFLESDQGNLSRYENHTRNLPFAAIPGVTQLFAWLEAMPPVPPPYPTAADKAAAQKKADWCRVQCVPLHEKLAALQKTREQGATLLHVVEQYMATHELIPPKMESWLAGQRFAAHQKMQAGGWAAQQEINRKIALLEADARFWQESILPADS